MNAEIVTPDLHALERQEEILRLISGYLTEEQYRFQLLGNDCVELYIQGKHLTMRMLIYYHNKHLVVRVPGFIRNTIDMRRLDILLLLNRLMNDYFDIRFELSEDGLSLSGSSNHILEEDGALTKSQFMQCMTIVLFLIDESYPKLMTAIFGNDQPKPPTEKPGGGRRSSGSGEKSGSKKLDPEAEEAAEIPHKNHKIN